MKILNRIVVFVLSILVFPATIFRVFVRAVVSINQESSIYKILSAFLDTLDKKMEITVSIKDAVQYWQDGKFSFGGMDISLDKLPEELFITKNWLIASIALIAVTLIIAVVIMGCALFAKAHKTVMGLSAGAMVCLFAAVKCFGKFAAPFIDGTIDIGAILADGLIGDEAGIIGTIGSAAIQGAITVDILQLGNVIFTIGVIFFLILMWTLAYYVTLPASEKKKKVKKIK